MRLIFLALNCVTLSSSSCYFICAKHETFTRCLQPILTGATISASLYVRPISFISFSTVSRQVAFCLPCFLFPWGVHLELPLLFYRETSLKHSRDTLDNAFLLLSELARKVFWRISPILRLSWARKSDRSYVCVHCEMPRSYGNPVQQLQSDPYNRTYLTMLLSRWSLVSML